MSAPCEPPFRARPRQLGPIRNARRLSRAGWTACRGAWRAARHLAARFRRRQLPPLPPRRRRGRQPASSWMRRRQGRLPAVRQGGAADGAGRPERAAHPRLGRSAGFHAAGRPGHAHHDRRRRSRSTRPPTRRSICAPSTHWWPGRLLPGRASCPPTTSRCWPANSRCSPTGTWSATAASRSRARCARAWTRCSSSSSSATWPRPRVFVHRDFMPRNLMMPARPGGNAPGRAGFPGRRARPHHLRHRQPDARRLSQLGRRVRARHHGALLAAGA